MDANSCDVTTTNGTIIKGFGDGFSAFIGLSNQNSIWTAGFSSVDNKIYDEERVMFAAGDCVILKYGTVHRGDVNNTGLDSFKVYTDVNTSKTPDNKSQLWVVEGEGGGYSIAKPL